MKFLSTRVRRQDCPGEICQSTFLDLFPVVHMRKRQIMSIRGDGKIFVSDSKSWCEMWDTARVFEYGKENFYETKDQLSSILKFMCVQFVCVQSK